eukprot:COSAG05_NODE_463_length_9555_cov_35.796108_2_plen_385_part_00
MMLLLSQLLSVASLTAAAGARAAPIVGAIRWDAYFSQPGEAAFEDPNFGIVTRTTTFDLSPKKWHYRVPFFGTEINDTAIIANGNTPEIMGQELEYARQHGIKFWSFCNYPIGCAEAHPPASACPGIQCCADNVGLSYAWNLYLNHPDNHKVNFTLLLQPGYWFHGQEAGSNETWAQELARYVSYFKLPNYQKVDIGQPGRPLVFSFGRAINQTHLQDLRTATKSSIGVYPYFVSMNGQVLPEIDAQSAYGWGGGGQSAFSLPAAPIMSLYLRSPPDTSCRYLAATPTGSDYVTGLAQPEANTWEERATKGQKQIPTVSAGNDDRPRSEYPMPWGPKYWSRNYVKDPSMAELEAHVSEGLDFVAHNPASVETNMMVLSACAPDP